MRELIASIGYDVQVRNRDFAAELNKVIQKGDTFLDAGCGELFIRSYIDRGTVFGIDIQKPKTNIREIEFISGNILNMPFGDGAFSFTGSLDVIEHLPLDAREKAIKELVRTCRSGVVIGFPFAGRPEALDKSFFDALSARSRETPTWLDQHLKQRYPAIDEMTKVVRAAFAERGHSALVSIAFSERIAVTKILRSAAVRSKKVFVLANTLFGLTIPLHPNLLNEANSYRALIFARVEE